jgi:hypothetical protein
MYDFLIFSLESMWVNFLLRLNRCMLKGASMLNWDMLYVGKCFLIIIFV